MGSGSGQGVRLLGLALVFYVSKWVLGVYQRPFCIQVRCQNSPVPSKSEKLLFKAGIQMFDMCLLKVGLLGEDLRGRGVIWSKERKGGEKRRKKETGRVV